MQNQDAIIEEIISKYEKLVYTISFNMLKSKEDAENIVQETFLSFYKKKSDYLEKEMAEIKNILCKIALNKCRDLLRNNTKKYEVLEDDYIEIDNVNQEFERNSLVNIEEMLIKKEREMLITRIVNELKSPYREVMSEYYIKDQTLDKVAEKLMISKATLKVQISRGKALLKKAILDNEKKGEDVYEIK